MGVRSFFSSSLMSKFVIQIPHENIWTTEGYDGFLRVFCLQKCFYEDKHVNFTVHQMRRHPDRYIATDLSASFYPQLQSLRTYLLSRLHIVTIHKCLNLLFKTVRTSEVKVTCYFLQTLHEVIVFKQLVSIINFLFLNLPSRIYNQKIVHWDFGPLPVTNTKNRITNVNSLCVSVFVQVQLLDNFHEHWC